MTFSFVFCFFQVALDKNKPKVIYYKQTWQLWWTQKVPRKSLRHQMHFYSLITIQNMHAWNPTYSKSNIPNSLLKYYTAAFEKTLGDEFSISCFSFSLSVLLAACLPRCLSITLPLCPSIPLSIHPCVCLSVCLSATKTDKPVHLWSHPHPAPAATPTHPIVLPRRD